MNNEKSKEYWEKRAEARLVSSERLGQKAINESVAVLQNSMRLLIKDIDNIYANYSKKGILDVSELKKALSGLEIREFEKRVREKAKILGISVNQLYDTRYLTRLTRLKALLNYAYLEYLVNTEEITIIQALAYEKIIYNTYESLSALLVRNGFDTALTRLDKKTADLILNSKFANGHFSSRIWKNQEKLVIELQKTLSSGALSGASREKLIKEIRNNFDNQKWQVDRLIRTETNYFHNQSELQSYIDDGFTKYRYIAQLDSRTSSICKSLAGQIFETKEAQVGVNYPPMHSNCRSGTVVEFTGKAGTLAKTDRTRYSRLDIAQNYLDKNQEEKSKAKF